MVSSVQDSRILKQLDQLVHQSFDIDFPERLIEEEKQNSQEDKLFLKRVNDSIELTEGHYELALPFKNKDVFTNNYTLAHQCLMGLKRRFDKNNKYFLEYQAFMNKMFEKGYAEAIQDDEPEVAEGQVWYIPHHGVYHPKKRKLRVVFNCAAKFEGTSLNDQLLSGPDLTNSLIGVLLRFRQENFAAMRDIESMFYQVRVKDTHKNYQRLLWWKDGNFREPPQKCRMTVHMFGTTSSPSCANIALLRTAADNEEDYDKAITDIVRSNFYVDDCLMSHEDESKLVEQVTQVTDLCEKGGFKLTKWMSNSAKVLEELPQECQAENMKDVRLDLLRGTSGNAEKDVSIERALGVVWKLQNDTLGFKVEVQPKENTKRNILSIVSSIYDPLGIVSPFVLQAKLLLRNICQQGLGWDEQTTGTLCDQWNRWLSELPLLEEVHVPRCFMSTGIVKTYQLHIFCDASEDGYGVAVYLRTVMEDNTINCNLVMAKSRVCPLKRVTIPRLELTAACLSVKISHAIQKELRIHLDDVYHWTDSMTVIRYIFNEATRFKTFVANRLAVIRDGTDPCQWKHVPGASNPADAASRGLRLPTLLKSEVWFHGPSFLFKPECDWPLAPEPKNSIDEDDPEIKTVVSTVITDDSVNTMDKLLTQCSSWMKLKRIVGWYLLYIENLQKKTRQKQESLKSSTQRIKGNTPETKRSKPYLTVRILQKSENAIFKYLQNQHFKDVLHHLTSEQRNETPKFRKDIRKLDPILSDGLIRVGGRLRQASLSFETRHPILLPKNSHVSKLIVCNSHEEVGHMGKAAMLTDLRQRYWILGAGALIKNVLSHCVVCRKYEARQKEQMMSDLPCDRLTTDEPPFSRVGVDFFGPFIVKRGRGCIKRYGVVFTCLTLRAIHLELSSSLDTSSCINAF